MAKSENGPVTVVSNEDAATANPARRNRDLQFNRWEKEFLNLAFPVFGDSEAPEKITAYDLFFHVPTQNMEVEAQLLATLSETAKATWAATDDLIKSLALEAFGKSLPKSEFPTRGKIGDLPAAKMRINPYGLWSLIPIDPLENCEVPSFLAELAVGYSIYIRPKLEKHERRIDVTATMIEASGFYLATVETAEVLNKDGEKSIVETGDWTSAPRRPNEDLSADLHAAARK